MQPCTLTALLLCMQKPSVSSVGPLNSLAEHLNILLQSHLPPTICGSTNATICQRKKMVGDIFFCCPTPLSPPMLHPSLPRMQKEQHPMPSLLINFFGLTSFAYLS
jgi:hypothetical protein